MSSLEVPTPTHSTPLPCYHHSLSLSPALMYATTFQHDLHISLPKLICFSAYIETFCFIIDLGIWYLATGPEVD